MREQCALCGAVFGVELYRVAISSPDGSAAFCLSCAADFIRRALLADQLAFEELEQLWIQ